MLALSTQCCAPGLTLDAAVASLQQFGIDAAALHRPVRPGEVAQLARLARKIRFVAIFGEGGQDVGCRLLVVEGGVAGKDRHRSLEELCRRLHLCLRLHGEWCRDFRVAVRTPLDESQHPSPEEIALLREALPNVGYWHDTQRGGEEFLHAGAPYLLGASFRPLDPIDLVGLRDAMPSAAPAVVALPAGTDALVVADSLRHARGVFR